jgi:hypothetical protein
MIISHRHKFIFLRTRKTAGTSIEIALSRFCGDEDVITPIPVDEALRQELSGRGPQNFRVLLEEYTPEERARLERLFAGMPKRLNKKRVRYYNHMTTEQVRALIGTTIWDEYFKFCFERNPWDRAISNYFWLTRKHDPRPSLLEFLRSDKGLSNFEIYSIDGEIAVDHVGLYEDMDSELERIAELLNLPEEITLPRAKGAVREDRRHYRDVMGHEERSIVERVCAREIAHFGYSF